MSYFWGHEGDLHFNRLSFMQALNALVLSNPALCIPGTNRMSFVRKLAPYLKTSSASETSEDEEEEKRACIQILLCTLSILSELLQSLKGTALPLYDAQVCESDLATLIRFNQYPVVSCQVHNMESSFMCYYCCNPASKYIRGNHILL